MDHPTNSIKNIVECTFLEQVFDNYNLQVCRERFDRFGVLYLLSLFCLANNCADAVISSKRFCKNAKSDMARYTSYLEGRTLAPNQCPYLPLIE